MNIFLLSMASNNIYSQMIGIIIPSIMLFKRKSVVVHFLKVLVILIKKGIIGIVMRNIPIIEHGKQYCISAMKCLIKTIITKNL